MPITEYVGVVARSSTTSDVFNAIAEARRREILDVLRAGEKPVGAIERAKLVGMSQLTLTLGFGVPGR